jgi:hypothetical protein
VQVGSEVGVGAGIDRISTVSLTRPGNQQPAANFEFSPAAPHAGTDVRFDATRSRDPDGVIKEYRWDVDGDGTFEETTTSPTLNTSLSAGRHNVTLEVWDGTARGNSSQSIDVSGLAYLRDLDTISSGDSATFTVRNDFSRAIELQQLLVDPADDSISELNEETTRHEVEIAVNGLDDHWVEYYSGLPILSGGEFIDLKYSGDDQDTNDYVDLDPGDTATIQLRYFDAPIEGERLVLGLKYQYGPKETVTNTTVFTDVAGGPDISNYQVTVSGADGQNVDVFFQSNQQLTDIEAQLRGNATGTLDEFDFSETQTGPGTYEYTADVSDGSNGTFTLELTTAASGSTGSADTPLLRTAYAGTGTGVRWQTAGDWDGITVANGNVVHAGFGDHAADRVALGYTRTGTGLVGYWPLDDPSSGTAPDESGNGNDGSVVGTPISVNGLGSTTSYQFRPDDGSDDYVDVSDSSSLEVADEGEVSVSVWVNKQATQKSETWVALFQHSDRSYNLQFNNGNEPEFTVYDGEFTSAEFNNGIENNKWVHLVGTFRDGKVTLYKDGQRVEYQCQGREAGQSGQCKDGDDIAFTSEPVGIGENIDQREDGDERLLDGKMDKVRVYNRALSETEVEDLYETFETSTFTTAPKTAGSTLDADNLSIRYDIDANAQVTTEARVITGGGETSDWVTLSDGSSQVDVSGISTDTDTFQIEVRLSTSSVTESPVIDSIGVVER